MTSIGTLRYSLPVSTIPNEQGVTQLQIWLGSHDHTHQWLADRIGVTREYVNQMANGKRQPSLPVAIEIEKITGIAARDLAMPEAVEK